MEMNYSKLKATIQAVIDCLVVKDQTGAAQKLQEANTILEELTDFAVQDEDLITLSKYRLLLEQLALKNG
ncbi:hypothetical protein [Flavobacterium luminosum]|uniref:Uncharacterized protein n=1 Tax=Flavobacterium luminosum TaxID=2949086 RepID=A0ABT0TQM6_9FLAO|nr:hypothetical protein [Flavobacterium sp. HXWNR70]MCL9809794.1 hypothetical protein [Flavobacterium sp. HXWNR70]